MRDQTESSGEEPRRNPRRRGLTDRELTRLSVGEHSDGQRGGVQGLFFRVRPKGGRSWALLYRIGRRRRRLTLGSWPALGVAAARAAAKAALRAIALGRDPAAEKRRAREADSFGELAERYMQVYSKPRKRSAGEDGRMLNVNVLPRWRNIPAHELTRRDVRELLEGLNERTPVLANRVRALLSSIFRYAISVDLLEHNPVAGTRPNPERARDRVLADEEIRELWASTEKLTEAMRARIRLQLMLGQRSGEVVGMRWAELDGNVWTIPGERVKNKLPHRIPLPAQAVEMIRSLPKVSEFVLEGARAKKSQTAAAKALGLRDFRFHDLRRTCASRMASLGVARHVIGQVLNHVERGVIAVYDRHSYDAEKAHALTRWSLELERITSGRGAVIELKR